MAATTNDKVLIGLASLVAVASAAGFGYMMVTEMGFPLGSVPVVELASVKYEPKAPDAPAVKTETWAAPVAQSRGRDWIYDTFTPPEIFYNSRSRQFTVKPPSSLADDEVQEAFGIELVAVRPEPFRLQLIGYVGGEGTWRGTFQNMVTGEVFLASAGRRIPALGVTIRSFTVRSEVIRIGESTPSRQLVASAIVLDEKAGADVVLTHRERRFTGLLTAFVALPGESATRETRKGDTFKAGEASYRVAEIQLTPPSADLVKEAPSLTQPDRRTLVPREAELPEAPDRDANP
jgi:hypothetical protein